MSKEASMFQAGDQVTSSGTTDDLTVQELPLPKDFCWVTATAAYQVEDGANQDGKACDHYNRVPEDIELMKACGVDAFLNTDEFTADFSNYARLCFDRFGDRVEKWITFNEPYIISIFGHVNGTLAPGHRVEDGFDTKNEPWRVGHTLIISYAVAVQLHAKEFKPAQRGEISIVLNSHFYEPYSDTQGNIDAAQRRLKFYVRWFGDPIFLGKDYFVSMRNFLGDRLPHFSTEERGLLRETAPLNTFYDMNHYLTKFARALPDPSSKDDWTGNIEERAVNEAGQEIGPVSQFRWLRVAPNGFRKLLNCVWERYHLPIIVTENGCPCPGEQDLEVAVDDKFRERYFGLYLDAISRAIYGDGIPVKGYYVWTLMDNFEWSAGYQPKFGIVHVNFENGLTRTPKNSTTYLCETFKQRRRGYKN
ncbi:beta-glucosidase [Fusarium agapanthi]|uniref:Beta-glucosidase n=1 Tax=Fusarium agapanthi TaxID=1803897 RepID=A0A9P5ED22_9HYPO|nr:beta-glucosidase [Fusarium agapanthi]